ncbi:hypothetical protein FO519_001338 [Halicephalobus sp. NKZ332]|nr:hypothetical protein FO519_001338 [Halicephalobus sp. NKZ332]
MVESLKHNLVQACDGEKITLHCPRNTHILIENVFYGRLVPSTDLCPGNGNPNLGANEDTTCAVSQAHSKITDLCRNKRKCKIVVKSGFFDSDPCPSTSKYLQISYKCKPISFEDQNFCEGSQMQLSCKQNKRLSIYSANYGRVANGHMVQCPHNPHFTDSQPVYEDCVDDVLPQVLQKCHAQTDCTIDVADKFLGSPCPQGIRKYLSLIFMCVNDEVFSEAAVKGNLESMKELEREIKTHQSRKSAKNIKSGKNVEKMVKDEPLTFRPTELQLKLDDFEAMEDTSDNRDLDYASEMEAIAGYPDSEENLSIHPASEDDFEEARTSKTLDQEWNEFVSYLKKNKEKVLLYFLLSLLVILVFLLMICICQQCRKKPKDIRSQESGRTAFAKSPELSSLIGGSSNTSPMFFDSDTHSRMNLDMGEGHYMRFSQVTPPRAAPPMHYYT